MTELTFAEYPGDVCAATSTSSSPAALASCTPAPRFCRTGTSRVMAAKLDACRRGEIKRLIINIPPRHLKSLAASIALPAWWLGHDPGASIINVSYAQDLSDKLARDCRTVMNANWYRQLFPTRLSDRRVALQEISTTRGGFRLATSIGGVLTGRGGDVIIIDDPLKPDEAVSETRRKGGQRVVRWHSCQPSQRQAHRRHRRHHAAAARGRSRRSSSGTRGLARRILPPRSRRRARRTRSRHRSGRATLYAAQGSRCIPRGSRKRRSMRFDARSATTTSPASTSSGRHLSAAA